MTDPRPLAAVHPLRPRARRLRRMLAQWPLLSVLAVVLAGLATIAAWSFRVGAVVVAGGLLLAFFLRLLLPSRAVGMLAVRSRVVDLIVLGALGGLLATFALWVPAPN